MWVWEGTIWPGFAHNSWLARRIPMIGCCLALLFPWRCCLPKGSMPSHRFGAEQCPSDYEFGWFFPSFAGRSSPIATWTILPSANLLNFQLKSSEVSVNLQSPAYQEGIHPNWQVIWAVIDPAVDTWTPQNWGKAELDGQIYRELRTYSSRIFGIQYCRCYLWGYRCIVQLIRRYWKHEWSYFLLRNSKGCEWLTPASPRLSLENRAR